jgi:NADH:ubiquinone oxidoreductase subunit 3 (subunit A)
MLDRWLPFLFYGALAVIIPASMIVMSFAFAQRPRKRTRVREIPFESGVSLGPPPAQRITVSF